MKAREGAALVAEQESLLAEYNKLVAKAERKAAGQGQLSPLEHWREATAEAEAMLAAIKGGLDDDDRRDVLAEDLHRRGADPVLVKAVTQPECMCRLLFAIENLARLRKSLICIRPVDRLVGRGLDGVTHAPWSH